MYIQVCVHDNYETLDSLFCSLRELFYKRHSCNFFTGDICDVFILGVLEEAEFYNVTDLIKLVKRRIAERDAKQNQVCLSRVRAYPPVT